MKIFFWIQFFVFITLPFLLSCSFYPSENSREASLAIEGYPIGQIILLEHAPPKWERNGLAFLGEHVPFDEIKLTQNAETSFSSFSFMNTQENAFLTHSRNEDQGVPQKKRLETLSHGTGFLVEVEGKTYLITNFHVACCSSEIKNMSFIFYNPYVPLLTLQVEKLIALSMKNDIAILELKSSVSFDENFRILPLEDEEFSNAQLEIRGFPSSIESFIQASIPRFSSNNLDNFTREICLTLDSHYYDYEDYGGMSGSPVLLKDTKDVVALVWGARRLFRTDLLATPIRKVLDLIHSGFKCEGWKDCFLNAVKDLKEDHDLKDPLALQTLWIQADCGTKNPPHHCENNFFKNLKQLIKDNPVKCLEDD